MKEPWLMLKNIIQHSPTNNIFFVTLHLIHSPKELAIVNHTYYKGVIEIIFINQISQI